MSEYIAAVMTNHGKLGTLVSTAAGWGLLPASCADADAREHGTDAVKVAVTGNDYASGRWEPYSEWVKDRRSAI